jgi:hypothetical protein
VNAGPSRATLGSRGTQKAPGTRTQEIESMVKLLTPHQEALALSDTKPRRVFCLSRSGKYDIKCWLLLGDEPGTIDVQGSYSTKSMDPHGIRRLHFAGELGCSGQSMCYRSNYRNLDSDLEQDLADGIRDHVG